MLSHFTNQYQLSKTLRFELKPVGETLKHIELKGLLAQDETRSQEYQEIKIIIDKYHKAFIEEALHDVSLSKLAEYETAFFDKNRDEKAFEKLQDALRKEIVMQFKKDAHYATLFKKELIKADLQNWQELSDAEKELVSHFDNFTTYFTGFHENRANMYTDEAKHSSIAYRIIHENLPIFLTNKKLFEIISQKAPQLAQETQDALLEHLNGAIVADMFELSYFNRLLSQSHIDLYNQMIGGVKKDELKIQGFNEKINLYRQANGLSKRDLPNLKPLHKQILSDRETLSWLPEAFENYEELVQGVQAYFNSEVLTFECCDGKVNLLEKLPELLNQIQDYDLSKIYFKNDVALTSASQAIFKDYRIIKEALWEVNKPQKSKDLAADEEKFFNKKNSYFSIEQIDDALKEAKLFASMMAYFQSESSKTIEQIQVAYAQWKQNTSNKELLKAFLEVLLSYQRLLKPLNAPNDLDKDVAFYVYFDTYFASLSGIVKLYDKVRNFMTRKPYSLEKFKLNFENKGDFLGGWVDSHTENSDNGTQAGGYLFRKKNHIGEYDYYLGISKDTKLFRSHLQNEIQEEDKSEFERLDYYQLKSASVYGNSYIGGSYDEDKKMLLKSIYKFAENNHPLKADFDKYIASQKGDNQPTPNGMINIVVEKYPQLMQELVKNEEFEAANKMVIERLKQTILSLHRVPKSQDYRDKVFSLFIEPIQIIEELSKEKSFFYFHVSDNEFKSALARDEKPLLLFKITNKDLSFADSFASGKRKSRGTENLHTLYFKALMSGNQNVYDIGTGEIFFRKKSIEYSEERLKKGHHFDDEKKLKDKFAYPIIKDRRFAFDKFQFHMSIIQNYMYPKQPKGFEEKVNLAIHDADNIKVIGIDRGERHLLYLSLIDSNGKIIFQETLNSIVNTFNNEPIDYHSKLDAKEKDRDKARKEWGVVENIKELKEGYLSHVVHKIATLIVEHGAVVAMEDLNFGFKRGRFKVEKQVYQKFEKALIDKLNYLVDKKKQPDELGGILNALQLTNKFQSFEKMGKQNGFLFYVPAWNTSKIDPVTGFVDLFDTRYASVEKSKAFFAKFKTIRYNEAKDYFEFAFDYNDFTDKAKDTRSEWTLCTYGERIVSFRNAEKNHQWDSKTLHLTTEFKNLFGSYTGDLKATILAHDDKEFFEKLLRLLRFTLQMRNSITGTDIDYLVSPVADEQGNFYDSRKADASLPKDADANGAYNIARKGLMLMRRIQKAEDPKKVNLAISNRDWLRCAQGLEK